MLLDENLLLEVGAVAHFHELMGVAGIAVLAGELASAVGIDGPSEGHADTGAAVEQGTDREGEVFNFVSLAQGFPLRSEPSDTNEFGLGVEKEGKGSHGYIRF